MMMSRSAMYSQTTPGLILPIDIKGTVRLSISAVPKQSIEKFGYKYLSVFVKSEGAVYGSNPVQGRYTIEDGYLVFLPHSLFITFKGLSMLIKSQQHLD